MEPSREKSPNIFGLFHLYRYVEVYALERRRFPISATPVILPDIPASIDAGRGTI